MGKTWSTDKRTANFCLPVTKKNKPFNKLRARRKMLKKPTKAIAVFYVILIILVLTTGIFLFWKFYKPSRAVIASGHPEWAPIMWQDSDKIVGVGPELVSKIFNDLNIKVENNYTGTWDVVQNKAKTGEVDVLVAAYKTDERLKYLDYSDSYTIDPIALFVKNGKSFDYTKKEDLINKKGVVMIGDSYGQEFDQFMAKNLTIDKVATAEEAYNELLNNQADYFIYALYSGKREMSKEKITDKITIIPQYVASENFYIAISKKSPFKKYLSKINEKIAEYKGSGVIDQMIQNYLQISGIN